MVTVRIPALPHGVGSNLLGLFGLVAVIVALGGLTHNWWWSLFGAGAVAVGLAVLAQYNAPAQQTAADAPTQPIPRIGAA
jgi:hypothetical protein